ncbi:MAG: MarR family transcriptional regulator [Burkholderiales bacterium]|nr:MAG: MarR family transcriptional regulator [Burkholderiales bacterium]
MAGRSASPRPAALAAAANDPVDGFIAGYLPYLLARASHLISGQFHERLAAERIPVLQWRVMAALWDAPKSAGEVAEIILQKQPTVSKLLERMQRQGLVDRETDAGDRRRVVVSLTPRGRAVAGPLIEAAREHERAVLEPFGATNASTLVTVLQRLIARNR